MKRLRYFTCVCLSVWLTLVLTATSAFAQEPLPAGSEAPLNIVVQSINAEPGAIQWVILILASAFLVISTVLLSSLEQRRLNTTVRTEGRCMSLDKHIQRQSEQNA